MNPLPVGVQTTRTNPTMHTLRSSSTSQASHMSLSQTHCWHKSQSHLQKRCSSSISFCLWHFWILASMDIIVVLWEGSMQCSLINRTSPDHFLSPTVFGADLSWWRYFHMKTVGSQTGWVFSVYTVGNIVGSFFCGPFTVGFWTLAPEMQHRLIYIQGQVGTTLGTVYWGVHHRCRRMCSSSVHLTSDVYGGPLYPRIWRWFWILYNRLNRMLTSGIMIQWRLAQLLGRHTSPRWRILPGVVLLEAFIIRFGKIPVI